ncbi:MAG: hypothetical protein D5R98_07595 [Desulfonatronovibrio sp. MSAO_Bac4]|nr:MAG: hypothetical protein D5R98_07595 [Desulfonatronovibrio sp. MSAO_Bac4]
MTKISNFPFKISLHAVLILSILGLGVDIYLRMSTGASICPTQACAIVGDYINITEFNLVLLGLVFFTTLWGVYFFASRYDKKWLWTGMLVLVLGALAFDGGLLGFQYFSIKEQCLLCFGVGAGLLIVLLLFSIVRKKISILILGLAVWVGGGIAGSMINIPDRAPLLEHISGISVQSSEAQEWPKFNYFFSFHCPFCTEILIRLAKNESAEYSWELFPLDNSQVDLKKIAWLMELDGNEKNIFYELVKIEQSRDVPDIEVTDSLENQVDQIRTYFRGSGFRGVPLMIVEESQGRRLILTGADNVFRYLYEHGILDE